MLFELEHSHQGYKGGVGVVLRWAAVYETDQAIERGREFVEQATASLDKTLQANIQLVCMELLANATRANKKNQGKTVILMVFVGRGKAALIIRDQGGGFNPQPWFKMEQADVWENHGRGIFIARNLSDTLIYRSTKSGMVVKATWNQ